MGDIFLGILNRGIAAGWLILAVMILRLLFRKAPKWIRCLLWGIVAVRLVCPFSIESAYSLIPSAETVRPSAVESGRTRGQIPEIDSSFPVIDQAVNPVLRDAFAYEGEESAAPLQVYASMAGIVWVCGLAILLSYAVVTRIRLRDMVEEGVCREGNIYLCDGAASPFVMGMISPKIFLPSGMDMGRINYVIAHEQAHLERRDHWWKPLGYLLLAVYWFHPLCWAAYILFCRDIELACDEKVIRKLSLDEKKEYSKALLSCSSQGRMIMVCPLAFGEVSVKERVKSVLYYKKTAAWLLAAAIVVCVIVGICFLTNPPREYQVRITVAAGSEEPFAYSDEEICPKSGTITVYAGEGLGDTEILLLPVESPDSMGNHLLPEEGKNGTDMLASSTEDSGAALDPVGPVYLTHGMPVRLEAERGIWYRIGVNVQNQETQDRDVFVTVKNVEIRIADSAGTDPSLTGGDGADAGGTDPDGTGGAGAAGDDGTGTGAAGAGGTGTGAAGTAGADGTGTDAGGTRGDGQNGTGSGENADQEEDMYAPHRYDMGDLDGNGEQEYVVLSFLEDDPDYDGHLEFYFNGELIYEFDDILWMSPGEAEYIDLDRDGKKEIFFTFCPLVNSMPLVEYAVLKQTGGSWQLLEMIHGETMMDNGFPISSRYGKEENTLVITCEGTEQEIVYDFQEYYENRIREEQENGGDPKQYAEVLEGGYREGDIFGGIAAWGVWEICSGTYDGRNCLIATHGLEGPLGKWDMIGVVDVYFDYNERGQVNILNLDFREEY